MENILNFLEKNYIWFLVAAIILFLALIGFIVDAKRKKKKNEGNLNNESDINLQNSSNINQTVDMNLNQPVKNMEEVSPEVTESFVTTTPSTSASEIVDFSTPSTSETMTFNDIPQPQPIQEQNSEPVKTEIIEPFDIGKPIVMDNNAPQTPIETFESTSEPVVPTVSTPTEEPAVNISEPVVMQNSIESNEEPIIKIE